MVFLDIRSKFTNFRGNLWISSQVHRAFTAELSLSSMGWGGGGGLVIFWNSPFQKTAPNNIIIAVAICTAPVPKLFFFYGYVTSITYVLSEKRSSKGFKDRYSRTFSYLSYRYLFDFRTFSLYSCGHRGFNLYEDKIFQGPLPIKPETITGKNPQHSQKPKIRVLELVHKYNV